MARAFLVTFKYLLCAGLCSFALFAQAETASTSSLEAQAASQNSVAGSSAVAPSTTQVSPRLPEAASPGQIAPNSASSPGVSSAPSNAAAPAAIGSGRHLLSVTLALAGIIGLIFAVSWFMRRFGQGGFSQNQHIKILAGMALGTRERIVLIDAAGKQLLLGITATQINTLHVFDEPVVGPGAEQQGSDFSRKLMRILQQKAPDAASGPYQSRGNNNDNNNNNDSSAR